MQHFIVWGNARKGSTMKKGKKRSTKKASRKSYGKPSKSFVKAAESCKAQFRSGKTKSYLSCMHKKLGK